MPYTCLREDSSPLEVVSVRGDRPRACHRDRSRLDERILVGTSYRACCHQAVRFSLSLSLSLSLPWGVSVGRSSKLSFSLSLSLSLLPPFSLWNSQRGVPDRSSRGRCKIGPPNYGATKTRRQKAKRGSCVGSVPRGNNQQPGSHR